MSLKRELKKRFKGQDSGPLATVWPSIPEEDRDLILTRLAKENSSPKSDVVIIKGVNGVTRELENKHRKSVIVVANSGVRPPVPQFLRRWRI